MFYEYEQFIFILNDDIIFNKILFMNTISSKEDKIFFEQFIDGQFFQQSTKNILNN